MIIQPNEVRKFVVIEFESTTSPFYTDRNFEINRINMYRDSLHKIPGRIKLISGIDLHKEIIFTKD